jgi:hypothetical protein
MISKVNPSLDLIFGDVSASLVFLTRIRAIELSSFKNVHDLQLIHIGLHVRAGVGGAASQR